MTLFFLGPRTYKERMIDDTGRIDRDSSPVLLNEEGPWGSGENKSPAGRKGEGRDGGNGDAPRNPWLHAPRGKSRGARSGQGQPSLEELIRRGRDRFSGGLPTGGRPIWGYAFVAFILLWLVTTSIHRVDPNQRGVVTRFGRYAGTLKPGLAMTLPAPVDLVTRVDVDAPRSFDVPASGGANLLLTRDQDLVNLTYTVRWSVRDPELYLFDLSGPPEDVIRDAAGSAMREAVARLSLDQVTGSAQAELSARVTARLQELLDRYRSGVLVQGVTIRQAGTPPQIADAIKDVAAARAAAQTVVSDARRASDAAVAGADGQAAAFDKVYQAYKQAPQVTRSRMYYDTMDAVMAKTDKVIVDTPNATITLPPPTPKKPAPAAQPAGAAQ